MTEEGDGWVQFQNPRLSAAVLTRGPSMLVEGKRSIALVTVLGGAPSWRSGGRDLVP